MDVTYKKQLRIRSCEVDHQAKIKLASIFNYFQDIAGEHSARAGVPVRELMRKKLMWVVWRYHVKILRYPSWGEAIRINTWCSAQKQQYVVREFEITDEETNFLVLATSTWMLIDLRIKKPVRPNDHLPGFPAKNQRAIPDDFESLPKLERIDFELPFRVRMHDVDLNRHVNNALYIEWARESVPEDILSNSRPMGIEVAFRDEAVYGDKVISQTQQLDNDPQPCFLHKMVREKDRKELTRLRTIWSAVQSK
jgi:medium-chain acyl-[acyl-carrier-protein] hydrolase